MSISKLKRVLMVALAMGLVLASGTACADSLYNLPQGVTPISHWVYWLHMRTFWICVGLGVVVFGIMLISIVFHRKSRGAKAAHFHENIWIELGWTIVPIIILVVMVVPAVGVLSKMYDDSHAAMSIKVTGYQWMWNYNYVGNGISFYSKLAADSNRARMMDSGIDPASIKHYIRDVDHPLVVPTGEKVRLLITSGDVIHSWWVPDFGGKMDAIPGYINEFWIKVEKPGTYRGQCAELCGRDHSYMPIVVVAKKPKAFRAWVVAHGGHLTKKQATHKATARDSQSTTPKTAQSSVADSNGSTTAVVTQTVKS